jgi:hypothetical protein
MLDGLKVRPFEAVDWHDWRICQILYREAEVLLGDEPPRPSTLPAAMPAPAATPN